MAMLTCKRCGIGEDTVGSGDCGVCRNVAPDELDEFVKGYREKKRIEEQRESGALHPFLDHSRRSDITFYPPVPGMVMQLKKVTVHASDGRSVEFEDDKGNYYRISNMPYAVVSFDPEFDPDTQGKLIRGVN